MTAAYEAKAAGANEARACGDERFSLAFAKKKKVFTVPRALYPLADTHAHLNSFWRVRPAEALARAALAGVGSLVTLFDPYGDEMSAEAFLAGLDGTLAEARVLLAQAEDEGLRPPFAKTVPAGASCPVSLLDNVRFLAGVHPYGAPSYTDAVEREVTRALESPLAVGVGEIGLDYHFDADDNIEAAPHDVQIACFEQQLALACARNVPVELHVRNDGADEARAAHADAYRVLSEVGIPAAGCVLHCFTEDRATMERFVELGCRIAFGGAATFKRNTDIREAFAACPLDRILFETDCPYMAPEPLRGIECEPALIVFTATALAQDRSERTGEEPAAIMRAAWENATALFSG